MNADPTSLDKIKDAWIRLLLAMAVISGLVFFSARLAEIPSKSALRGWDNSFYLFWLRSAVIDGDLDFANELETTDTISPDYATSVRNLGETPTGLIPNKYGIGWALASLPWYLAADLSVQVLNKTGMADIQRDGFGPVYQVFLQTGQLAYALAGLLALAAWARRYFNRRDGTLGIALLWLTSPLLYYQSTNLSMSHSLVFTLVSVLMLLCDFPEETRRRGLRLGAIGFLAGLCLVTRFQSAPFLLMPLALLLHSAHRGAWGIGRSTSMAFILGLIGFLIPVLMQMGAWKIVYGQWLLFTYGKGGESFSWGDPELLKVLFHPYHGLFYWHPFLLAGLAGLLVATWRKQLLFGAGVGAILLTIYINASWHTWQFGASFGHRGFIGTLPFFAIGLIWLLARCHTPRQLKLLLGTGTLLAAWNIWLCVLYCVNTIDRNGPVLPADIVSGSIEFIRLAVAFIK